MGTHPIFESDFDCLTVWVNGLHKTQKKQNANNSVLKERLVDINAFAADDPAKTLAAFLSPITVSEFEKDFYQKKHFKIDRSSDQKLQNKCGQLFNRERLEAVLKLEKCLPKKDFLLVKQSYGSRCVQSMCENYPSCELPENFSSFSNIQQMINDQNYNLKFFQPQRFCDDLWRILSDLEAFFQSVISCYVSVLARGKTYGPQFDNTDNFILQLNSTQEIKIWENPEGKLPPFNSDDHELNETDLGEPLETISMRVGDCLYLPRGFVYSGVSSEAASSFSLNLALNQDMSSADWLVQNLNTVISKTAMRPSSVKLRENLPFNFHKLEDKKAWLEEKLKLLITNFSNETIPTEQPHRKNFFTNRLPPYKKPGQIGKLKSIDLNCSIRLTTREHIYLYEEDNVDEDEPGTQEEGADGDDMYEDVTEMDDFGEEENFQHNLSVLKGDTKGESNTNGVDSKDIERILAEREQLGLDEADNADEDGVDDREGDGAGEPAIVF